MDYLQAVAELKPPAQFSAPRTPKEFADQSLYSRFLSDIVRFRNCKTIVEIGVACGVTTSWLCQAAIETRGTVFGFDIWDMFGEKNENPPFGSKEFVDGVLKLMGYRNFELTKISTLDPKFPSILKEKCPKIDFAFLDAWHSYKAVSNEFRVVYPLMAPDGIIAFHDTGRIDGCREFMLDLRTKFNDGTFDIVDLLAGNDPSGVSLLVKRSWYSQSLPILEVSGSNSTPETIIKLEQEWYRQETSRAKAT